MKVDEIIEWFSGYSKLDFRKLTHKRDYFNSRVIFVELCMKYSNEYITCETLSKKMGYKNHSSIVFCRRRFKDFYNYDVEFRKLFLKTKNDFYEHFKDKEPEDEVLEDYSLENTDVIRKYKNLMFKYKNLENKYNYLLRV